MNPLVNKIAAINKFLRDFRIPRKLLFVILGLLIIQVILEMFSAGLIIPFLDSFRSSTNITGEPNKIIQFISHPFLSINPQQRFVYILSFIFLTLTFIEVLFILNNRLILRFSMFTVQNEVSRKLFSRLLDAQLKFFYKQRSGNLINLLTTDVNRAYACIKYLLEITCWLFFVLAYIAIGLLILPRYTCGLLIVLFVCTILFRKLSPYIYSLGQQNRIAQEDANNIIVETMQGFRNIILSCAQAVHNYKFKETMYRFYNTIYKNSFITTSLQPLSRVLLFFVLGLVCFVNKNRILSGGSEYFIKLFFFIYVAGNIFRGLGIINSMYSSFAFNYEGIMALLQLDVNLKDARLKRSLVAKRFQEFSREIEADNLSFEYNQGERVINSIKFQIPINKKIAFVGRSGSGKSTLIDLISGFYDDYTGMLKVDGEELKSINKDDWRNLLGYVSQETFIFNDTIRNNLLFGFQRKISEEEIRQACKNAQLLEAILSFREQFDTLLGERGVRLSGGEKQRLAITRIFLKNPAIILLDEATSSLDSESEKRVKLALNTLSRGRTTIAVSHRLSTIADFDQIYVLEKGSIVESGTHTELLAKKGYYYNYYIIQSMQEYCE